MNLVDRKVSVTCYGSFGSFVLYSVRCALLARHHLNMKSQNVLLNVYRKLWTPVRSRRTRCEREVPWIGTSVVLIPPGYLDESTTVSPT